MNEEFTEIMYGAMFNELSSIEKEGMEKDAILGAVAKAAKPIGQGFKQIAQAVRGGKAGVQGLGQTLKGAYTTGAGRAAAQGAGTAGQVWRGVAGAAKTPVGRAGLATAGGVGALGAAGITGGAVARRR